jgi:serine protease DegQ
VRSVLVNSLMPRLPLLTLLAAVAAAGCQRHASTPTPGASSAPGAAPTEPPSPSLSPGSTVTPKTEAPSEARVLSSAFSAAARALRPSVVRIDVEIDHPHAAERDEEDDELAPFFRHFFGQGMPEQTPGPQRGTGSGVVMDARGDIVTNRHVVSDASKLKVILNDGREFTAKTLGTDAETDVAVIRLDKPPGDLVAASGCSRSAARWGWIRR